MPADRASVNPPGGGPADGREFVAVPSRQGEDHEDAIEAAYEQQDNISRSAVRSIVDAYRSRVPSPVSGTEPVISGGPKLPSADSLDVPVSGTEPDTAKLRAKLDEMALVDDTRDPHDEGYMGAVVEMREWLAGFSVDAGKARRCCGIIYGHGALTGPQPCPGCPDMEAGPDGR